MPSAHHGTKCSRNARIGFLGCTTVRAVSRALDMRSVERQARIGQPVLSTNSSAPQSALKAVSQALDIRRRREKKPDLIRSCR